MTEKAVDALRRNRAEDSERKRANVAAAIEAATQQRRGASVSAIAKAAGVSRQFIYSHNDLLAAVERVPSGGSTESGASAERVEDGLRVDRRTALAKVERQRETIDVLRQRVSDLEAQRKRWLGSQLDGGPLVDVVEHAELRAACDRLIDEKRTMTQTILELRRINDNLSADLAASRAAHAETARSLGLTDSKDIIEFPRRP